MGKDRGGRVAAISPAASRVRVAFWRSGRRRRRGRKRCRGPGHLDLEDQGIAVTRPLIKGPDDWVDLHSEACLNPVGRLVDVGPVEISDDKHVYIVCRRTGRAAVPVSPRAEDQDGLGVVQVELLTDDRLRPEGDFEELGEWSCGSVAQIRAEKPCPPKGPVLEQAGDDESLRLTLQGVSGTSSLFASSVRVYSCSG